MKYCTLFFYFFFTCTFAKSIFFHRKVFDVEAIHDHNYSVVGWSGNVNGGITFSPNLILRE
jgi:hypothetical protein